MTIPESKAKLRPFTAKMALKTLAVIALTALLLWIWETSIVRVSKNFHEVDPGKFYRSAQLSPQELEEVIQQYGIKTVISLRGAPAKSYWVQPEIEILEKLHVKFHSFAWKAGYFPETEELKGYLRTLKTAEFPVLVHCRTGADRTGEAAALYAIDFMSMPKDQAIQKHLNFQFWHIQGFHPAKKEFVRRYPGIEQALAQYDHCAPENRDFAQPGKCASPVQTANSH